MKERCKSYYYYIYYIGCYTERHQDPKDSRRCDQNKPGREDKQYRWPVKRGDHATNDVPSKVINGRIIRDTQIPPVRKRMRGPSREKANTGQKDPTDSKRPHQKAVVHVASTYARDK